MTQKDETAFIEKFLKSNLEFNKFYEIESASIQTSSTLGVTPQSPMIDYSKSKKKRKKKIKTVDISPK